MAVENRIPTAVRQQHNSILYIVDQVPKPDNINRLSNTFKIRDVSCNARLLADVLP